MTLSLKIRKTSDHRLAVFRKFLACGERAGELEACMRFKRTREEVDKDEGKYVSYAKVLDHYKGCKVSADALVERRRRESKGTSTDRNDPDVETFLLYGDQSREVKTTTLAACLIIDACMHVRLCVRVCNSWLSWFVKFQEEISFEMGCDASAAFDLMKAMEHPGFLNTLVPVERPGTAAVGDGDDASTTPPAQGGKSKGKGKTKGKPKAKAKAKAGQP